MAIPKKNRVTVKKDFDSIFRKGKAVNGTFLFMKYLVGSDGSPQLNIIVSSKTIKKAATRNRVKRVLSALVQLHLNNLPQGIKALVVVTKSPINNRDDKLREDFLKTLKKSGLYE